MIHVSRKRWLASASLVAIGVIVYAIDLVMPLTISPMQSWEVWLPMIFVFGGIALAGAGAGNVVRRPLLGALGAIAVYLAFVLIRFTILGPSGMKQELAAQIASGVSLPGKLERGFRIEGGEAIYRDFNVSVGKITRALPGADIKTFRALKHAPDAIVLYAVDATHVYLAEQGSAFNLASADSKTFEVLDPKGLFVKDSKNVYFRGAALQGADPGTFEVLEYPFGKDRHRAFIGIATIPGADMVSWQPLQRGSPDDPWSRISDRVQPRAVGELLPTGWSRDSRLMYWGNKIIPEADPATFELLTTAAGRKSSLRRDYYSKDKDHVFYGEQIIPGADRETFQVDDPRTGPWEAHDAAHRYAYGKVLAN